jgi:hypothetical protein
LQNFLLEALEFLKRQADSTPMVPTLSPFLGVVT